MPKLTFTWKGWRFYAEGAQCVATNGETHLRTSIPAMPTDQHGFFLASEQLKHDIRNLGRADRAVARR